VNAEAAQRLVEARLGRPPQDALEAAVVLEAWAGVPAQRALETARTLMPGSAGPAPASSAAPRALQRPPGVAVEAGAFFVTVFAIALWVEPLARALGGDAVSRALVAALPLTLALQWALLARHLGRPAGLAGVGAGSLAAGAVGVVAGLTLVLGTAGTLAGLLTVTWTAGGIVIRRRWAVAYCVAVAGATPALAAGADPLVVVAVVAAVVAALALLAILGAAGTPATPGRWSRTLGAGLTGAGVGLLIVGDPSVTWTAGASAALALAPSTAGALWAGQHLWRLAGAFPRALVGVPACAATVRWSQTHLHGGFATSVHGDRGVPAPAPRGGPAPAATLVGAIARLAALAFAGSAVLLLAGGGRGGVLAGFGAIALATLLVGLIESLGRPSAAALGVAAGVVAELLVRLAGPPFPGAALLAGGVVAVGVLAPAAFVLLSRPARTLATSLWIT
jgi:hypothetical protein